MAAEEGHYRAIDLLTEHEMLIAEADPLVDPEGLIGNDALARFLMRQRRPMKDESDLLYTMMAEDARYGIWLPPRPTQSS